MCDALATVVGQPHTEIIRGDDFFFPPDRCPQLNLVRDAMIYIFEYVQDNYPRATYKMCTYVYLYT